MSPSKKQEARVVIAIPLATSMIYWRTVAAILEMKRPTKSDLMVFQGALVDRARNQLIEQMLNHPMKPTHILFLDADIVPELDTLSRLLSHKVPIISGLYRKRLPPHEPMAFLQDQKNRLQPIKVAGEKPLQKVDVVGGGCLLIQREVFQKVKAPWFTSEWTDRGHLSEDFSFCQKAKKAGFSIWIDLLAQALHIEPVGIGTDFTGKVLFVPLT